jgi:hypothetical protein
MQDKQLFSSIALSLKLHSVNTTKGSPFSFGKANLSSKSVDVS